MKNSKFYLDDIEVSEEEFDKWVDEAKLEGGYENGSNRETD